MLNDNTLRHNLKRGIINFWGKISDGFSRPTQKFIADMIYDLLVGGSCYLNSYCTNS